jgi:hypothetical protein
VIGGHLVDFGGLRKMRIAPEQSKLESWVLRRSKENNFSYRMVLLEFKIEWEKRPESRPENVRRAFT